MTILLNKALVQPAPKGPRLTDLLQTLQPEIQGQFRLETDPLGQDYDEALAARVADPLWMLTRQWQFREFDGEDAGSPLEVAYRLAGTPIVGYAPGAQPADATFQPLEGLPLEPLVEAEPVLQGPGPGHARANIEAGQVLLRLLDDAGFDVATLGTLLRQAYPATVALPTDPLSDPAGTLWHLLLAERGVDAARLARDAAPLRTADGGLTALPEPLSFQGIPDTTLPVLDNWLRWMDDFIFEQTNAAWRPERQEYAFELAAGQGQTERWRLDADEYTDGRIDWHDFDLRPGGPQLLPGELPSLNDTADRASLATPVQYPGMPARRFWEFEDATVNFARLDASGLDMVRMMVTEYALVHGNDWFMVPARVKAGGLYRVVSLRVTDTFGRDTAVDPITQDGGVAWRLHGLHRQDTGAAGQRHEADGSWLCVPPPLSDTLEGGLLEEVAFARDEMANLAWAIEKRVQGSSGEPLDRSLEDQRFGIGQQPTLASTDARLLYRLMTPVASHWLPLVPVRQAGNLDLGIQLERGGMKRFYRRDAQALGSDADYQAFLAQLDAAATLPGSFVEDLQGPGGDPELAIYAFHPRGLILRRDASLPASQDGLRIEEEELARTGFTVERRFQYARTASGRAVLWVGRRKRTGRGETSSGLAFDLGLAPRT